VNWARSQLAKEDIALDIKLDKIQTAIAKEARKFLKKKCDIEYAREMFDDPTGYASSVWNKMSELDWMSTCIPEKYGGAEMDQLDLCVLLEEMGRALLPGPFFATVQMAAAAIIAAGSEDQKKQWLPQIGVGEMRAALAYTEVESGADPGHIQLEAKPAGDGFVLNGAKIAMEAHVADIIVLAARTAPGEDPETGITLFALDPATSGVAITPLPNMDGTRKLCAVEFKDVRLDAEKVLGEVNKGWPPLRKALQRAQVGLCAECVGGAQMVMETAVEHAKTRVQYDQPIGAFQSIKHMCSEMYVGVESARSLVYWAAWAQEQEDVTEASLAASAAMVHCPQVFRTVAMDTIQVFGGLGCTWEYDTHLYLRRAKENQLLFGDAAYHREQIVRLLT
jgi:alkylation response protein AidB-like acyl-CoA dehydrogenase